MISGQNHPRNDLKSPWMEQSLIFQESGISGCKLWFFTYAAWFNIIRCVEKCCLSGVQD